MQQLLLHPGLPMYAVSSVSLTALCRKWCYAMHDCWQSVQLAADLQHVYQQLDMLNS